MSRDQTLTTPSLPPERMKVPLLQMTVVMAKIALRRQGVRIGRCGGVNMSASKKSGQSFGQSGSVAST